MPIIGNPWAQDAAAFGQQVGQNLSQGLLQLPMKKYELAMQQAQLQRALQQMQMQQEYRQGLLGLRQQVADQTGQYQSGRLEQLAQAQQGLDAYRNIQAQNAEMANQIHMLAEQGRLNQPLVVPQGASVYNRQDLMGGGTNQPQQGLGQPSPMVPPVATAPPREAAPITQNQLGEQFLKATLPELGMYGTNVMQSNPGLWRSFTNFQATGQVPSGWGQQTTNQLMPSNQPATQNTLTNNPATGISTNRIGRFLVQPVQ